MDRRSFLLWLAWALSFPLRSLAAKKKLPKGFPRDRLKDMNPAELDTSDLEVDPLEEFGVMGTVMDLPAEGYRLKVHGAVADPLELAYGEVLALPRRERRVLLICPGFFAFNALWEGVELLYLLHLAGLRGEAKGVKVKGADGFQDAFSLREVEAARMILAHHVNGVELPKRHGFPLRLVAEGLFGERWVKYVTEVEVL